MNKYLKKFRDYIVRTYKNKIGALAFILLGYISYILNDGDGTFLMLTIILGVPLFIMDEKEEE